MRTRVRGHTLVALLVAGLLGALLLLVVVEVFLACRSALLWQEATARLEAAGGRALTLLGSELRMAGFQGMAQHATAPAGAPDCGTDGWPLKPTPALAFADRAAHAGVLLSDGSAPGCLPLGDLLPGSDLLATKRTAALPSRGSPPHRRRVRETQWYLLVDGAARGRFSYLGPGQGASALGDGMPWEWHARIFYVRAHAVVRGDGLPTLCVERLRGAAMRSECLVEGVERLHLEFAVDADGDGSAETRVARPTAEQLAAAPRATIYLLLRSVHSLPGSVAAREFVLGRERVIAAGGPRYLRRVFTLTVPLANQGHAL